jgi:pyruvate dehydrogenase E1 component alpha subunit
MSQIQIESSKLLDMYKKMVEIRQLENRLSELAKQGRVGTVHLAAGEEASAVGCCAALREEDYVVSTHRSHGHVLAKGGDMNRLVAEIMAKKTGYNNGKGGDLHVAAFDKNMLVSNAIVGGGIPMATGVGLTISVKGWDKVVMCFFGDGAANIGTFHESLNLGAVWKLPVIYVCENNLYGNTTPQISTVSNRPTSISMAIQDISLRANAYGMPGVTVDGMDPVAVYEAARDAVQRARQGSGPTLIECKTYRYFDHSEGQPQNYRTKEEVERYRKLDPIPRFRAKLIEVGLLSAEEASKVDQIASKQVEDAIAFAEKSPDPDLNDLARDLYGDSG